MEETDKYLVQASEKSLAVVEYLKDNGPARITHIAQNIDMGESTVHSHLSTLVENGYVIKEEEHYSLGLKFLGIAGQVRNRIKLYHKARPKLQKLSNETGLMASLLTEERGRGIYLINIRGEEAVTLDIHVGLEVDLHSTALGKAILAYMSKARIESIIGAHGLQSKTPQTITDPDTLYDRLESVRERGYAVDRGERQAGLRCVAAPIRCDEETVIGAISLSAPETRVADEELDGSFAESIISTANVIELELRC
jgi:DNA-binding IclR family transcriptional regulator